MVAADQLVRQALAEGRSVALATATVGGGLGGQYAVEDELLRGGLDRAHLGREAFVARAEAVQEQYGDRLRELLAARGVVFDAPDAAASGARAARAARTAFVRLFDEGLVVEDDRVVDVCARCATVVTGPDSIPVDVAGDVLLLRLPLVGGDGPDEPREVEVRCIAPELLPGVVAVVVPPDHPAGGAFAVVPLGTAVVPVLADASATRPDLVIPAHDPAGLELGRRVGLAAVHVLDADGTVVAPGPLEGLARYAARAAARQLLEAEGAVGAVAQGQEAAAQCVACGTVLVARLGRHWFLCIGDLMPMAADAVRNGHIEIPAASVREDLLGRATDPGEWCLSRQLWTGEPVPVTRCGDCGQIDVAVDPAGSCGKCMGHVVPDSSVLDARFVRCAWPLAASGWPDGPRAAGEAVAAPGPGSAVLVVAECDLDDVLPMVALGLRLSGDVPFASVTVAGPADAPS